MRDIRNGHIEGKLKCVIPSGFAVKHGRTKAFRAIRVCIAVDETGPAHEFFPVIEEAAVMVQVLDHDFETPILDGLEKSRTYLIAILGNDSESGFDAKCIIYIHQIYTTISANFGLNV